MTCHLFCNSLRLNCFAPNTVLVLLELDMHLPQAPLGHGLRAIEMNLILFCMSRASSARFSRPLILAQRGPTRVVSFDGKAPDGKPPAEKRNINLPPSPFRPGHWVPCSSFCRDDDNLRPRSYHPSTKAASVASCHDKGCITMRSTPQQDPLPASTGWLSPTRLF